MDPNSFIRNFIRSVLQEGHYNEHKDVNLANFLGLYRQLIPVVHDDENLRNGLEFAKENIADHGKDPFVTNIIDPFLVKLNAFIATERPDFFDQFDRGYSGNKRVGSHYKQTKDLDVTDVAKLIKQELAIEFPQWKFSVRIERFSGGRAINVYIVDMPYDPFSAEKQEALRNNQPFRPDPDMYFGKKLYNDQYEADYKKVKHIGEQYRMNDSDGQIDYFHTNFYYSVSLEEQNILRKFHPDNLEFQKHDQFMQAFDAKQKERSAQAAARKGKYKKGMAIIFVYDKPSHAIPKGEYEGVITKAPNGRSWNTNYDISFLVDKKFDANRNIVPAERPMSYRTSVAEKDIRPKENI